MKIIYTSLVLFQVLFLASCNSSKKNENKSIEKLDLQTSNVIGLMQKNKLTGTSIAVIENYKIIWSEEYGYKENGKENKIDENTSYSTASITKAI